MKIRNQVYIISFVSSIIPLTLLGILTYFILGDEFEKSEREKLELVFINEEIYLEELLGDLDSKLDMFEGLYIESGLENFPVYLDIFSKKSKEVEYFAFGSSAGKLYIGEDVVDVFPDNYDPRNRPWYIGAIYSDPYFVSDIFTHAATGEPAMTISKKVIVDGEEVGIVLALLKLDVLRGSLKRNKTDKLNEFFLVDLHGQTVISTDEDMKASEFIRNNFHKLVVGGSLEFENEDTHKLYYSKKLKIPELTLVGSTSEEKFMAPVINLQKLIFILIFISFIISTFLILIFGKRFSNSLKRLSYIIDNIARGDYSENLLKLDEFIDVKSELYLVKEAIKKMQDEIRKREDNLKTISEMDPLTKIFNKGTITDLLNLEITRSDTFGTNFSVIMFDLDKFKNLNDTYGHLFGDEVLKGVTASVTATLKHTDYFGRYGGEEFIIVLPDTKLYGGIALAERIRKKISDLQWKEDTRVNASFGVIEYTETNSFENVINLVDGLLYRAKKNGRNRVEYVGKDE